MLIKKILPIIALGILTASTANAGNRSDFQRLRPLPKKYFQMYDLNENYQIPKEEYFRACVKLGDAPDVQSAKEWYGDLFNMDDKDSDGIIIPKELE